MSAEGIQNSEGTSTVTTKTIQSKDDSKIIKEEIPTKLILKVQEKQQDHQNQQQQLQMHQHLEKRPQQQLQHQQEQESPSMSSSFSESIEIAPYFAVGPYSHKIVCPLCKENVRTELRPKTYYYSSLFDCLMCLSCCFPALCILCVVRPFCPFTKNHHYCPKCKGYLGRFRRS